MRKNYFHNSKISSENKLKKKLIPNAKIEKKSVVDINILLNRVKIAEKNEIKKKIIFSSLSILTITLFVTFVSFIK